MLEQPSNRRFGMHTRALYGVAVTSWRRVLIPRTWRFRCGRLARHLRGARYPIRRRIENPGLAAAPDGSPGVNAALGRGTTAGASSGARHRRAGGRSPPTARRGWVGRLQVDQHDRRGPCRSEPARRARAGRSSGSAQRRRDATATVVTRTRKHACVRTTPPPGRHIVTTTTEAVPRGAVAAKVRCPIQ